MEYIEAVFEFSTEHESLSGILVAELSEIGFNTFDETSEGLKAYIPSQDYKADQLQKVLDRYNLFAPLKINLNIIPHQNWNAVWEENFNPVNVSKECYIRAPFHQPKGVKYEIVIEPKMAFGTGHHETTFLMASMLLEMEVENKKVIDMGCGTGILAILAAKMGAQTVDAIDIDPVASQNAKENAMVNNVKIDVFTGDAGLLRNKSADIILANINRNILLKDLQAYENTLHQNGVLLLSGFYTDDLPFIREKSEYLYLTLTDHQSKNNWVAARFEKKS